MNHCAELQKRLEQIARTVDLDATVSHDFDAGAFIVRVPDRDDVYLREQFVADHSSAQVADAIRLRWGLPAC